MSEEIFDVVNERDEVIGRQSRREVHRLIATVHECGEVLVGVEAGLRREIGIRQQALLIHADSLHP